MSHFTAIYDACVLYPAPLRSLLMHLAMTDLYRAKWTDAIHEEWMRSVLKDYPDITLAKAQRIRDLMNAHVLDCLTLLPFLSLPWITWHGILHRRGDPGSAPRHGVPVARNLR